MQKKQDGKILPLKSDDEKLVIKLERMRNDWVRSQKETIWNLITSDFIELAISPKYRPKWYRRMLTELDNLQGTEYHYPCLYDILVPLTDTRVQETTMWYNNGEDVTAQSKNYFLREIHNISTDKRAEAAKKFGLTETYPKDYNEAEAWLKAGNFKFDLNGLGENPPYNHQLTYRLTWVNPTIARDEDGYNQYAERLNTETKRIERIIVACRLSDENYDYNRDGSSDYNVVIDAIEELEGWDWTPPAKVIPSVPTLVEDTGEYKAA